MIVGAAVGLAIPVVLRVYEILQFGLVRPAVLCLFWPTSLVASFNYPHSPLLMAFTILGNMFVFGAVAAILRRRFLIVLTALFFFAWTFSPPSNTALRRRFDQNRTTLEQMVEMSKS